MIYKNLLPYRVRWIKKMAPFNFTIYYKSEIKINYTDFTSKMKMFLPKNSTSNHINTLKK